MKSRLKQLEFMWYEELHISNELRAYCRKHYKKDYYLYKGVPGIGGITAAAMIAELGDIRRFNRLDELAAIVGLVPWINRSGEVKVPLLKSFSFTDETAPVRSFFFEVPYPITTMLSRLDIEAGKVMTI